MPAPIMEAYYVVKRGGARAQVRFGDITGRNQVLCSPAYGRPLDHVERLLPGITQEVILRFKDGVTTHELDMITARVCADRSTWHQDYSDLAARIIVSDLQKTTAASFGETVRRLAGVTDADGANISRLHPEFVAIVERAAPEIDRRIDHGRDFRFTCFGIQTMVRSYLMRARGADEPHGGAPAARVHARGAGRLRMGQADRRGHEADETRPSTRAARAARSRCTTCWRPHRHDARLPHDVQRRDEALAAVVVLPAHGRRRPRNHPEDRNGRGDDLEVGGGDRAVPHAHARRGGPHPVDGRHQRPARAASS